MKPYFEKDDIIIYYGDCLEVMNQLAPMGLVLTDLPYGTTACKWDSIISLEPMWANLKRIIKKNGAIVLTASQPFTTTLISSNMAMFKYCWVWEKSKGCNFMHAKNMPIKFHEDICVFSHAPIGHEIQLQQRRMEYNPQGLLKVDAKWERSRKYDTEHKLKRDSHKLKRIIEFTNYPKSIIRFSNSDNRQRGAHSSQKPVALMEYLIKTYTNEGETVLDFAAGSGTTGIACGLLNRKCIMIEIEEKYCEVAAKRIDDLFFKQKKRKDIEIV